jgi:hypothetical protein
MFINNNKMDPVTIQKTGQVAKKMVENSLEPKDSLVIGETNPACTLEVKKEIEKLIGEAYRTEDDVKMVLGFAITAGPLIGGGAGHAAGAAIGAIVATLGSTVCGVIGAIAGTILVGGGLLLLAKKGNDEYNGYVKQVVELDQKYHCGYTDNIND